MLLFSGGYGVPMVFPWCSSDFPMVVLWFSLNFPILFLLRSFDFPIVFLVSHGFPLVFL